MRIVKIKVETCKENWLSHSKVEDELKGTLERESSPCTIGSAAKSLAGNCPAGFGHAIPSWDHGGYEESKFCKKVTFGQQQLLLGFCGVLTDPLASS